MRWTFPSGVLLSDGRVRSAPVQKRELAGLGEAVLRWMGALSSTERCDKLLARRVARDEGAVQAGVPISFIAMFGGRAFVGLEASACSWGLKISTPPLHYGDGTARLAR